MEEVAKTCHIEYAAQKTRKVAETKAREEAKKKRLIEKKKKKKKKQMEFL